MSTATSTRKFGATSNLAKLREAASGTSKKDLRFWDVAKTGPAQALIRFLPCVAEEEVPWVKLYRYSFKVGTNWYIENSPTTIGLKDPCTNFNAALWATGNEALVKQCRNQARREVYISNILVLKDPANPANEGKVFLYRYGKKIMAMIKAQLQPEFEGDEPKNPFDFYTGSNFKLKVKINDGGFPNYDASAFDAPSPLFGGDDLKLTPVFEALYPLQPFIAPDQFKSFRALQERLALVLNRPDLLSDGPPSAIAPNLGATLPPAPMPSLDPKPLKAAGPTGNGGDGDADVLKNFQAQLDDDGDDVPF
jgi:hypothetical protein